MAIFKRKRYFLFSWTAALGNSGNMYATSYTFPSKSFVEYEIRKLDLGVKGNILINSIFEFKNKKDFDYHLEKTKN